MVVGHWGIDQVLMKITSEYVKKSSKRTKAGRTKEENGKFMPLPVRERGEGKFSQYAREGKLATTILFLAVRKEPNPNVSRSDLVFDFNSLRWLWLSDSDLGDILPILDITFALCLGSPPYSAFLEPERELQERTRDFRERLKALCSTQRASDGDTGPRSSITRPTIPNTNFWQIPSHVMSTITHATQFHGLEDEDAPGHLSRFARICDTFNITGVSKDAIYLRLFPFSLSAHASTWLDTLPDNSITTWEDLEAKFFKKYYPPSRATRLRDQIHSFRMDPDDPYHMVWERFNAFLSRCPQHGRHIMERLEPDECEEMFESFAQAEQKHPHSVRNSIPTAIAPASSPRGVHQFTPETSLAAALASMANEIKELKLSSQRCQVCKGGHDTRDCPVNNQEHVSFTSNQNRGYNNYNSFGSGWRSGNNPSRFNAHQQQYGGTDGEQILDSRDTLLKNQQSAFQDLQRTVGDIAQSLKDLQGGPSSSSNVSVMAVLVRSVEKKEVVEDDSHSIEYGIPSVEEVKKGNGEEEGVEIKSPEVDLSRIPYPARVLPYKNAREYGTFLDMFKQLKVNLLLIEVLQHMPKYGKFLKDLLSNKKKLEGISKVSLSEQCSAVVQNQFPEKLPDSGRFTIPCLLGSLPLNHALADMGASINLMSYSVYKHLDLGEPQPTRMSISLADHSVKYPRGVVENLLVKVGKFAFPMYFVILDMEVDDRVPLILGRPFLRTAKAMIDVFDGKLTLRVGDESVIFDAMKSVKDVGEHSHFVCILDALMDDHRDYDPEREIDEPAPNLGEISDWALELEGLLDEPDDYGNEVLDDLLEMIAEFEDVIGTTPSVGKLVASIEDPDDPGEGLEVPFIENLITEPLPSTIVLSEGRVAEPTPSSDYPRSRPPRKRTRELIDLGNLDRVHTPSVGTSRGDKLLGYLMHIIFGPGRYKLWWKDLSDRGPLFDRSSCLLEMWRTGRLRRVKAVPVSIKEKPPDRLA
ncbi:hypothetical protein L1987_27970 [Smallanthus sonchifolius]|uniref:Uncharacterized protein n=1 Tax=Smallanthus sonchifolius TaxID=185202 RepID=A0ACB9IDQ3_9ASTR|nr:hypothetical protein L1987_27970 [Smallanthus sonchifolius]